jgi:hypothetical protein
MDPDRAPRPEPEFTLNSMTLTSRLVRDGEGGAPYCPVDLAALFGAAASRIRPKRLVSAHEPPPDPLDPVPGAQYEPMPVGQGFAVEMACHSSGGAARVVGFVIKQNGRAKARPSTLFQNQASFAVSTPRGRYVHVKVFCNGKVQLAGATSVEEARLVVDHLVLPVGARASPEISPCLVNCRGTLGGPLDRHALYLELLSRGVMASFEEDYYSNVKVSFLCRYPAGYPLSPDGSLIDRRRALPPGRPAPRPRPGVCPHPGGSCEGQKCMVCCHAVTGLVNSSGFCNVTGAINTREVAELFRFLGSVRECIAARAGGVSRNIPWDDRDGRRQRESRDEDRDRSPPGAPPPARRRRVCP